MKTKDEIEGFRMMPTHDRKTGRSIYNLLKRQWKQ